MDSLYILPDRLRCWQFNPLGSNSSKWRRSEDAAFTADFWDFHLQTQVAAFKCLTGQTNLEKHQKHYHNMENTDYAKTSCVWASHHVDQYFLNISSFWQSEWNCSFLGSSDLKHCNSSIILNCIFGQLSISARICTRSTLGIGLFKGIDRLQGQFVINVQIMSLRYYFWFDLFRARLHLWTEL